MVDEITRNMKAKNNTAAILPTYKFAAGLGCVTGVVSGGLDYVVNGPIKSKTHALAEGTAFFCNWQFSWKFGDHSYDR